MSDKTFSWTFARQKSAGKMSDKAVSCRQRICRNLLWTKMPAKNCFLPAKCPTKQFLVDKNMLCWTFQCPTTKRFVVGGKKPAKSIFLSTKNCFVERKYRQTHFVDKYAFCRHFVQQNTAVNKNMFFAGTFLLGGVSCLATPCS